jgi:hypothetical protein
MPDVGSNMKIIIIVSAVLFILLPVAWAKRLPTPIVEPVTYDGIRYIAPNDDGTREYIQALEVETGKLLKEFTVKRNFVWRFWIEADVQLFYITKLGIKDGYLVVTDEKNRVFKVRLLKKANEN